MIIDPSNVTGYRIDPTQSEQRATEKRSRRGRKGGGDEGKEEEDLLCGLLHEDLRYRLHIVTEVPGLERDKGSVLRIPEAGDLLRERRRAQK